MVISYAITVCNEEDEIRNLTAWLLEYKRDEDEVVILVDSPKCPPTLKKYLNEIVILNNFQVKFSEFKGNFSEWKNELNSLCVGDYIFNIDADEIPNKHLLKLLPKIIEQNPNVELFKVPRENTVEGITEKYIKMWGWVLDSENRINFPDYQSRIYLNNSKIKWVGKVHESIRGHRNYVRLPNIKIYSLYHPKTLEKQIRQNELYSKIVH